MEEIRIKLPVWNIEEYAGYKPRTTFWQDFSIAERFGEREVRDTFRRAMAAWKSNHVYLTELVLVLNHKLNSLYVVGGTKEQNHMAEVYNELWQEAEEYAQDHLQGDELRYFYRVTD